MTHHMSQSNALTTAVSKPTSFYLMHLTNQTNVPKQANTAHSVVNSQPQHQVPLCLQCHDGSYLSLSLSTLVPTLPGKQQCFRLQSQGYQSVQTSVKLHCSCTLLNLRCFNYSRITLQMWQTKPRSTDKANSTLRGSHANVFQSMATKPGHRPFRVLMPIFLNSVATKPRLLTLRGSHAELSQLCGN